jgi:hypothetical protein
MTQFYVYVHCRPDGSPFYVGKGSIKRAHEIQSGRNPHHRNIVRKYVVESIQLFMYACKSEYAAFRNEEWMIAWCRAQGHKLTNMSDGGEGPAGQVLSKATRMKMAQAHEGVPVPREKCDKIAATLRGKKHSAERCLKASLSHRGLPWSEQRRAAHRPLTKEQHPFFGKHHSEETRLKISSKLKSIPWSSARRAAFENRGQV